MAKYILRFRRVNKDIFADIRNGRKIVETRSATARFKKIKPGDTAVFICGKERFEKRVREARTFKNIASLLNEYKIKDIMPQSSDERELARLYHSFPGYKKKIEEFGLVALEFDKNS